MGKTDSVETLRVLLAANIPVKLESLPGTGKTSVVGALVRASDGYMYDMTAVTRDPTDFGGIPVPDISGGRYVTLPGQWARDLADACAAHKLVVLFLDEFNTAGRAVAAACLKVVDERKVGDYNLPAEVRMVMAVNPAEANGGVDLTPAMANRVGHVPFEVPLRDWADGLSAGFPDPEPVVIPAEDAIAEATAAIAADVSAYARQVGAIDSYPEDVVSRSRAWPSRRSWTLAVRAMATARAMGLDAIEPAVCGALVGQHAADEFVDWRDRQRFVSPEAILADPTGWAIPTEDDVLYRVMESLTDYVLGLSEVFPQTIEATCAAFHRVAEDGRPGLAAACIPKLAEFLKSNRGLVSRAALESLASFRPILQSAGLIGGTS